MKKITLLFAAAAISAATFGQPSLKLVKQTVGNANILRNWDIGEVKYLDDVSVQRVSGANDADSRTNLFYTSNRGIINEIDARANEEMFSDAVRNDLKACALSDAAGGQLSLFFDRNDESLANPSLFVVTVRNEDGTVVYHQPIAHAAPQYYRWEIWYYYTIIDLPVIVGKKFLVEIADAGLNKNFSFLVINMDNPETIEQVYPISLFD